MSLIGRELGIPSRLSWGQIGANDLRVWKYIAHFNGPDSGPSSNVKDCFWIVDGSHIEFVPQCYFHQLVGQIKTIQLALGQLLVKLVVSTYIIYLLHHLA